jgi:hypothetical protein
MVATHCGVGRQEAPMKTTVEAKRRSARPDRLPRDPGREVLEGLFRGFAVALLVCIGAFASGTWLTA